MQKFLIDHSYEYTLNLDGLPSATILRDQEGDAIFDYYHGVKVGRKSYDDKGDRYLFFNHLEITVETHKTLDDHERIVGFDVEAFSIAEDENRHDFKKKYSSAPYFLEVGKPMSFTYTITSKVSTFSSINFFQKNPKLTWQSRMDHYRKTGNDVIHKF